MPWTPRPPPTLPPPPPDPLDPSPTAMPARTLDLDRWPRRAVFDHFMTLAHPWWGVTTRLDVARLDRARGTARLTVALYYVSLRLAALIEPLCCRLEQGRVRVYDQLRGSATVLRADDSLAFAPLPPARGWEDFAVAAASAIDEARARGEPRDLVDADSALLHFTVLPWIDFTSFSHARSGARDDATPKIGFGRLQREGDHLWLPLSIEVHHALVDGLHVGRWVQAFESVLQDPAAWLQSGEG